MEFKQVIRSCNSPHNLGMVIKEVGGWVMIEHKTSLEHSNALTNITMRIWFVQPLHIVLFLCSPLTIYVNSYMNYDLFKLLELCKFILIIYLTLNIFFFNNILEMSICSSSIWLTQSIVKALQWTQSIKTQPIYNQDLIIC